LTRRILVVANDHVGTSMAGPGIRSYKLAVELSRDFEVTLVVPFPTDLDVANVDVIQDDPWDDRRMRARVQGFDAVVTQCLPVPTMRRLARADTIAIYDLYAPWLIESLALSAHLPRSRRLDTTDRLTRLRQTAALTCGDGFICASERQRDLWLGALLALGRIDDLAYGHDPSLRSLIDVVPFGMDAEPPRSAGPVLRGVVPGIDLDDHVLLWGGGIWNWFDPLTVIRAVHRLSARRPSVRLYFLGLRHPSPGVPAMEMTHAAVELADELGVRDRSVFFNFDWVPYEQRGSYFLEADVGVSAHFDNIETRFAFRTRLLDCFWAGLPVVCTRGDVLAARVEDRGLGRCVGVEAVDGWVEALDELLSDDEERGRIRVRLEDVRAELAWPRVLEPLRLLVAGGAPAPPGLPPLAKVEYAAARLENAVLQHGVRGAADRALRMLTGRTAPLEERAEPPLR
jgi:glycosyltransferase involved in cell wall biosynthesis